jgi:hypothetical protein
MSTSAYVDLMFAWGHARLGDEHTARRLIALAAERLRPLEDRAHNWLLRAFSWHIDAALQGHPHRGSWPPILIDALEMIDESRRVIGSYRYVVDRLRQQSRILEPDVHIDAYHPWLRDLPDLARDVSRLLSDRPTDRLAGQFTVLRVAADSLPDEWDRLQFYSVAMSSLLAADDTIAPALIAAATELITGQIERLCAGAPPPSKYFRSTDHAVESLAWQLSRVVGFAGRLRQSDVVKLHLQMFLRVTASPVKWPGRVGHLGLMTRALCKALAACGLRVEAGELLSRTQEEWAAEYRTSNSDEALLTCITLAGLDYWHGREDRARRVLDLARANMPRFDKPRDRVMVACESMEALALARWPEFMSHFHPLIDNLGRVPNGFTTSTHFSRLHLEIADRAVLAITTPDFGPPAEVRRSMPKDEFAGRREALSEVRARLVEWGQQDW